MCFVSGVREVNDVLRVSPFPSIIHRTCDLLHWYFGVMGMPFMTRNLLKRFKTPTIFQRIGTQEAGAADSRNTVRLPVDICGIGSLAGVKLERENIIKYEYKFIFRNIKQCIYTKVKNLLGAVRFFVYFSIFCFERN